MSEAAAIAPQSALMGAHHAGRVVLADAGLIGMVSIRGDLGDGAFRAAVAEVTGHEVPDQRGMIGNAAGGLGWMSPDELMAFCPHAQAEALAQRLRDRLAGTHHMVTVLSDARAEIRLSGAGWREVLAKGAPVDLHPASFTHGEIRRSRLGQVPVAFWATETGAELVCFRSVAGFVFEWLVTAETGGPVGLFD